MNLGIVFHFVAQILAIEGILMFLPCICALIYQEKEGLAFLPVIFICLLVGILAHFIKPKRNDFYAKEAMVTVSLSWILMSMLGALPFVLSGDIESYVDALFEIVSGFTTTGSSILLSVEAMSKCMLFWRCFTNWIGGMGILVFMLAIIPIAGGASINLMRAESPGPSVGKLVPKMRQTAATLYKIYLVMTIIQIIVLALTGMPIYDCFCISFASAGTGGFAVLNSSCADYSILQQGIIAVFILLFGVNFSAYFYIISYKFKQAFKMEEVRMYIYIALGASLLIAINALRLYSNFFEAFHYAFFNVSSVMTTSGFANYDFNNWPEFSRNILVILMFVGACAGSTGGGVKVSRVIILLKTVKNELRRAIQPKGVRHIHLDGKTVDDSVINGIYGYFMIYIFVFVLSFLIVSIDNFDFTTTFTAIATTINNVGPGLEMVGPTGNFSAFSDLSKLVMIFDMLAGRLELLPILILLSPFTYKKGIMKIKKELN